MTNQTVFDFLCVVQFSGYIAIISKRIFLFFGSNCSSSIVLDVPGGHNPWPFFSTMSLFLGPVLSVSLIFLFYYANKIRIVMLIYKDKMLYSFEQ